MKVFFIRHGESLANTKVVKASDPDFLNTLTETGVAQAQEVAKNIVDKINAVYSSPYTRTMMTAQTFIDTRDKNLDIIVDDRLREIDYGIFGDNKAHPEMIEVAKRQIAGDYEVRFGRIGENKRELITRLFDFLIDIFNKHGDDDVVVAVSHGRVISILDYEFGTVNGGAKEHVSTKNAGVKEFILNEKSIANLQDHVHKLNEQKHKNT
ncbi:MAG: histidine phosphatase family protein [Alphaproteobacteria bacterium]|nr:histidine phosphatase family protein [Alphaproteobacteria bacterium]